VWRRFLAKHAVEEIETSRLGPRGIIQHRIEAVGDIPKTQSGQLLDDTRLDRAHWPPPVMAAVGKVTAQPASARVGADTGSMRQSAA
jgi:hypothetical protein